MVGQGIRKSLYSNELGKLLPELIMGQKSKFSILNENASQVTLAKMDENSIFVFLLGKKTREFTGKLLHLLDLKEVGPTNYGTCEIMD